MRRNEMILLALLGFGVWLSGAIMFRLGGGLMLQSGVIVLVISALAVAVSVCVLRPEAQALHPFGKIPGFRHGDIEMCESRAIIDYVDAVFDGARLVPTELKARIRSDVWTSLVATSIEPLLIRQFLFAYMFPDTTDKQPDRTVIDALTPKVDAALDVLEAAVAAGEIGGGDFGRVDAYLVPILFYLRTTPEGGSMLAALPHLTGYLERVLTRPSVQATMPPPPSASS